MEDEIFREILGKAHIDYHLLNDPDSVLELAGDIFDQVMLEHADGDPNQPISAQEEEAILKEVARRLVIELHQRFHGR